MQLELLEGNPERFVLKLKLGKISCTYRGGSYSASLGGNEVGLHERHKKYRSPVCGHGKYSAGDVIEASEKITARILSADHSEETTTIRVKIEQVVVD